MEWEPRPVFGLWKEGVNPYLIFYITEINNNYRYLEFSLEYKIRRNQIIEILINKKSIGYFEFKGGISENESIKFNIDLLEADGLNKIELKMINLDYENGESISELTNLFKGFKINYIIK